MTRLVESIRKPSLFYFPRKLFDGMENINLDALEEIGFLNTMIFIDKEGDIKPYKGGMEPMALIAKDKLLKANIFELLSHKSNLDESSFYFLLKEYNRELENWVFTTKLIEDDAGEYVRNYQPHIQPYLKAQRETLEVHRDEMKENFGSWQSDIDLKRFLDLTRKKIFKNNKIKVPTIWTKDIEKPEQAIKRIKKNQQPLVGNEEADQYLLKHVFNVEL